MENMHLHNGNHTNYENNMSFAAKAKQHNNVLTLRETEILQLAANGNTTAKIATQVFLIVDTVEGYRKSIIRKMRAANITHAVADALRKRWIV